MEQVANVDLSQTHKALINTQTVPTGISHTV